MDAGIGGRSDLIRDKVFQPDFAIFLKPGFGASAFQYPTGEFFPRFCCSFDDALTSG
jgi:hypothetical protein